MYLRYEARNVYKHMYIYIYILRFNQEKYEVHFIFEEIN